MANDRGTLMKDGSVIVTDSSGNPTRYPSLGDWWRDDKAFNPVKSKASDDAEWQSLMADLRKFTA